MTNTYLNNLFLQILYKAVIFLQGVRTFAQKDGDGWVLNGSKVFITNGWMADVVIVVAITDKTAKSNAHGISLFLVDGDAPGFVKGKKLKKMGLKAQVK